MVAVTGIGGLPEPANTLDVKKSERTVPLAPKPQDAERDDVAISEDAERAAEAARLSRIAAAERERQREERLAEAKRRIEEGTYRIQEVVSVVAQRISGYIPTE
ncbi:MAG: flagellar biosynthesis anti-sigma factor FlgM [Candidatus Hydrogenedentes bacterium]|nr:flagellar biosynthesis anti-sigma factor FlgM [Candidatus Hydrogenedentota bacterium]